MHEMNEIAFVLSQHFWALWILALIAIAAKYSK